MLSSIIFPSTLRQRGSKYCCVHGIRSFPPLYRTNIPVHLSVMPCFVLPLHFSHLFVPCLYFSIRAFCRFSYVCLFFLWDTLAPAGDSLCRSSSELSTLQQTSPSQRPFSWLNKVRLPTKIASLSLSASFSGIPVALSCAHIVLLYFIPFVYRHYRGSLHHGHQP